MPGFLAPHSIRSSTFIGQALQGRKLEDVGVQELSQILSDVETLVRHLSEELVQDLGVRDELEFEKVMIPLFYIFVVPIFRHLQGLRFRLFIKRSEADPTFENHIRIRLCIICKKIFISPYPSVEKTDPEQTLHKNVMDRIVGYDIVQF